jgi:hypothetical protein
MASTQAARKPARTATRKRAAPRKWSAKVTAKSDAMDLEEDVFRSDDPKHIATSVKRSAQRSRRRKAGPFQSAMSMLNFYVNRAGKNLSASHRKVLQSAKRRLRVLFHRPASS